jgi:hypothetical protein
MAYAHDGDFEGQSLWFYTKMGLVMAIRAAMIISAIVKPGTALQARTPLHLL